MPIDFDLTPDQRKLKYTVREFAREVLRPAAERADALADPQEAFAGMKPAYEQARGMGLATGFLPREYGGGGASNVDFLIAVEELCAVDPGFPTILLVNGLALMPLLWFGTEQQREHWIGRATSASSTDYLAGWVVSERGGTANFDHPSANAGIQVVADHDKAAGEYVLNGEKHWPCNAGGWDLRGADVNLCVVRTDRHAGGKDGLSGVLVERDTPGVEYEVIDKIRAPDLPERDDDVPQRARAGGEPDRPGRRRPRWSTATSPGPGRSPVSPPSVSPARAYEFALKWARTYTGGGLSADHRPPGRREPPRRRRGADRGRAVPVLEGGALPGPPRRRGARARRDEQDVLRRRHAGRRVRLHADRRGQLDRPEVRHGEVLPGVARLPALRRRESRDAAAAGMGRHGRPRLLAGPLRRPEPFGFKKSMEGFGLGEKR